MALNVLAYINYDSGINVHGVHIPLTHRRTIAWDTLTERFYLTETTQLGGHTWMVRFSPTKKEAFVYPGIFIELCDTLNHAVWLFASKNFEEIASVLMDSDDAILDTDDLFDEHDEWEELM